MNDISFLRRLLMPVGSGGGGVGSSGGGVSSSGSGVSSGPGGVRSSLRATALSAGGGLIPDPNMRRTDLDALHPVLREGLILLQRSFDSEELPFRVFETFRSPQRQAWLFAQGRTRQGSIVTHAQAWESYHQYGLAVDFVLWLNNSWSWSTAGVHRRYWTRLHDLGRELGLEPLSFEKPHLQVAELELADLRRGIYPDGGDDAWRDNLEAASIGWTGQPESPAFPSLRPMIAEPT